VQQGQECTGEGLDVDAPLGGVELEGLEGPLLAELLVLIDKLVTSIVPDERERLYKTIKDKKDDIIGE